MKKQTTGMRIKIGRKRRWVPKIKRFRGVERVQPGISRHDDDLFNFIVGMGYLIYEDPTDETMAFISDRPLTYGWLKKTADRWQIDLKWWKKKTDFDKMLRKELPEFTW